MHIHGDREVLEEALNQFVGSYGKICLTVPSFVRKVKSARLLLSSITEDEPEPSFEERLSALEAGRVNPMVRREMYGDLERALVLANNRIADYESAMRKHGVII